MEQDEAFPIKRVVSVPLEEHRFIVSKLFEAIASASRPPSRLTNDVLVTVQELFEQALQKDRELSAAVKKLSKHQEAQAQLNELQKEDKRTDAAILNYARRLKASEERLHQVLKKHSHVLATVKSRETVSLNPQEVVAYAHRIAGTTSAPTYWKPGFPMFGFAPPAPQEQMMRAGVLSRGFIDEIVTQQPEQQPEAMETTGSKSVPEKDLQVPLGISIPQVDIAKMMPPGWKPGDPVVLPKDVSIPQVNQEFVGQHQIQVPDGWKPGDPIPFSAMQNALKRSSGEKETAAETKKRKMEESDSDESSSDSEDGGMQTISLSLSSDEDSD